MRTWLNTGSKDATQINARLRAIERDGEAVRWGAKALISFLASRRVMAAKMKVSVTATFEFAGRLLLQRGHHHYLTRG